MPIAFGSTPITSVSRGANAIASAAIERLGFPGQTASVFSAVSPPDAPTNVAITVEEDYAAPSQVTGLAVDSTGDGTIDLSWTAPASEAAITDYRVEYTPSGGSAAEVLVGSAAASYQLTGLTNDTEYSVRVAAISAGGQGDYSAAVTGTPGAVIDLTPLATVSGNQIRLQNLSSLYPDVYGSAASGATYNFQQFGWQLAALEFTGGYSPAGPFPIQFGSNAGYISTTITTATGGRTVNLWRLNGYIAINIDGPCGTRIDVTNIVLEKVTDGVVTHRFGPYSSPAISTWGCGD